MGQRWLWTVGMRTVVIMRVTVAILRTGPILVAPG